MNVRRKASALLLGGFLTVWLATSDVFAATATLSDVTDFITRLGGYLFQIDGLADNHYNYWVQVFYTVNASGGSNTSAGTSTPSGGSQSPSGGGQNTSGGGSNITKIVMTKFPMAALLKQPSTAPAVPTSPTTTSPSSIQLNPCEPQTYIVEAVTLDLRDIQPITDGPKLPTEIIKDKSGKQHKIWSVVLQTNEANNFIRQNTQTFPATCPPTVAPSEALDAKMEQTDVPQYSILFADLTQANRFVKLLNNVIPTLNPPVLIPPPK